MSQADVVASGAHPGGSGAKDVAGRRSRHRGDSIFRGLSTASAVSIIVLIVLIALFLLIQAIPSLRADHVNFLTSAEFDTNDAQNLRFGIRDLLVVTLMSSIVALILAVPVAVFIALFITMYAPRSVSRVFGSIIDLLAAVPSIVFGLWGIFVLAPKLEPVTRFLNDKLGWFPLFGDGNVSLSGGGNIFTAALVLGIMILPIMTAISREVFRQTPQSHIEAATALGATRWEVIRTAVLPYGRSGTIAGAMLGLGRALGETVAVLIILRTASAAAQWLALRRRLHLCFQDRLRRCRVQ